MSELVVRNAIIESAWLGFEDHGILSAFVMLDYGGSSQGFGGYNLEGKYMAEFVKGVLQVVGVERWEQLKGKAVRAETTYGEVLRLGNFIEDKWFCPKEMWAES